MTSDLTKTAVKQGRLPLIILKNAKKEATLLSREQKHNSTVVSAVKIKAHMLQSPLVLINFQSLGPKKVSVFYIYPR